MSHLRGAGCCCCRPHERPPAGRGDNADRDAVLQRPRRVGPTSATPACSRFVTASSARSPMTTRSECSSGPATCSRWCSPGTWTASRPSGRYGPAGRRPLPCRAPAGSARPSTTDRSGMYSFPCRIRRGVGQLAALAAGRTRVSRLTPYRCARALPAGQADSRLPLPADDARPQISRDTGCRGTPCGTSAAVFVPDAPGRIGVPSP
jgi:hypothetical protein